MKQKAITAAILSASCFSPIIQAETTLEYEGLIEVEAASSENSSDITLATLVLGAFAQINDRVDAELVLLYEEEDTPFGVDTAIINLGLNDNFSVTAGQYVVPFGSFETAMISDPLTMEIAETHATALQVNFNKGPFSVSAYAFNGINAEDEIDNSGISLGYANESLSIGIDYIVNIGDSDSIAAENIAEKESAGNIHFSYRRGDLTLLAEYLSTCDALEAGTGIFTAPAQLDATHVEVAYAMGRTSLAVGLQQTKEAEELGLPETRTMLAASYEFEENTAVALEIANDKDYADESTTTVTAQLAVLF